MSAYSPNTIAVFVWSVLMALTAIVSLTLASQNLYRYRRETNYRTGGGAGGGLTTKKGLPLLLRYMYVAGNVSAVCCTISCAYQPLIYTEEGVNIDPWKHTSLQSLSVSSQVCAASAKFNATTYAFTKCCNYLFFFIKQRTVRPMSQISLLEKLVLSMTLGVGLFAIFMSVVTQGDRNGIDGTCQLWVPVYILIVLSVADCVLSFLYLYLFVQPLRETLAANDAALRRRAADQATRTGAVAPAPEQTPQAGGTLAAPESAGIGGTAATAPPPSTFNKILEEVMKKNAYSCLATVAVANTCLFFLLGAHLTDNQYLRKWCTPFGSTDVVFTAVALTHLMRSSNARSGPDERSSKGGGAGVPSAVHTGTGAHSNKGLLFVDSKIGGAGASAGTTSTPTTAAGLIKVEGASTKLSLPPTTTRALSATLTTKEALTPTSSHRLLSPSASPAIAPSDSSSQPSARQVLSPDPSRRSLICNGPLRETRGATVSVPGFVNEEAPAASSRSASLEVVNEPVETMDLPGTAEIPSPVSNEPMMRSNNQ